MNRVINKNGDGSSGTDFLASSPTLRKFLSFRGIYFFLQAISANLSQLVNSLKNECFVIEGRYESKEIIVQIRGTAHSLREGRCHQFSTVYHFISKKVFAEVFYRNVCRCYVDKSNTCQDATPSKSRPGWVWSCEACDTHRKKTGHPTQNIDKHLRQSDTREI